MCYLITIKVTEIDLMETVNMAVRGVVDYTLGCKASVIGRSGDFCNSV